MPFASQKPVSFALSASENEPRIEHMRGVHVGRGNTAVGTQTLAGHYQIHLYAEWIIGDLDQRRGEDQRLASPPYSIDAEMEGDPFTMSNFSI